MFSAKPYLRGNLHPATQPASGFSMKTAKPLHLELLTWQVQKSRNKQVQMIFDKGFGIHHVRVPGKLSRYEMLGNFGGLRTAENKNTLTLE